MPSHIQSKLSIENSPRTAVVEPPIEIEPATLVTSSAFRPGPCKVPSNIQSKFSIQRSAGTAIVEPPVQVEPVPLSASSAFRPGPCKVPAHVQSKVRSPSSRPVIPIEPPIEVEPAPIATSSAVIQIGRELSPLKENKRSSTTLFISDRQKDGKTDPQAQKSPDEEILPYEIKPAHPDILSERRVLYKQSGECSVIEIPTADIIPGPILCKAPRHAGKMQDASEDHERGTLIEKVVPEQKNDVQKPETVVQKSEVTLPMETTLQPKGELSKPIRDELHKSSENLFLKSQPDIHKSTESLTLKSMPEIHKSTENLVIKGGIIIPLTPEPDEPAEDEFVDALEDTIEEPAEELVQKSEVTVPVKPVEKSPAEPKRDESIKEQVKEVVVEKAVPESIKEQVKETVVEKAVPESIKEQVKETVVEKAVPESIKEQVKEALVAKAVPKQVPIATKELETDVQKKDESVKLGPKEPVPEKLVHPQVPLEPVPQKLVVEAPRKDVQKEQEVLQSVRKAETETHIQSKSSFAQKPAEVQPPVKTIQKVSYEPRKATDPVQSKRDEVKKPAQSVVPAKGLHKGQAAKVEVARDRTLLVSAKTKTEDVPKQAKYVPKQAKDVQKQAKHVQNQAKDVQKQAKDENPESPPSPTARLKKDPPGSPKSPTNRVRRLGISTTKGPTSPKSAAMSPPVEPPWGRGRSGGVTSPTGGLTSPTGRVTSPTGRLTSPTGRVTSPTDRVTSPTGRVTSPTGRVTSPTGRVTSPTGRLTSPTGRVTSPTGRVTSPTGLQQGKAGFSYRDDRRSQHVSAADGSDDSDSDDDLPVFRVGKKDARGALKALKAIPVQDSPEQRRKDRPRSEGSGDFFGSMGERSVYKKDRPKSEVIYEGMVAANKERTSSQKAFSVFDKNFKKEDDYSSATLPRAKGKPKPEPFGAKGNRPVSWGGQEAGVKPSDRKNSMATPPSDSSSSISSLRDRFMRQDSMSSSRSSMSSSRESSVSNLRDRFMSPPPPQEEYSKSRSRIRVVSPPPGSRKNSGADLSDIRNRLTSPPRDDYNSTRDGAISPDPARVASIRNRFASPPPKKEVVDTGRERVISPDPAKVASIRNRFKSPPPEPETKNKPSSSRTSKLKDRLFSPPPESGPSAATKLRDRIFPSKRDKKERAASPPLPDVVSEEKPPGDVTIGCCGALAYGTFLPHLPQPQCSLGTLSPVGRCDRVCHGYCKYLTFINQPRLPDEISTKDKLSLQLPCLLPMCPVCMV